MDKKGKKAKQSLKERKKQIRKNKQDLNVMYALSPSLPKQNYSTILTKLVMLRQNDFCIYILFKF